MRYLKIQKIDIIELGERMYIGNVEIKNRIIMAPMAGITNLAFRVMMKEFGV